MKLLLSLLVIGASGCWYRGDTEKEKQEWADRASRIRELKVEAKTLSEEIRDLTADRFCEIDSHCDSIGVGPILCGKRQRFLVFSRKRTNMGLLTPKVREFNQMTTELNKTSFKVLNCGVDAPKVECRSRRCVQVRNR